MRSMTPRSARNAVAGMLAGVVLAATFLSPVSAHVGGTPSHMYNTHLYSFIKGDFFTKQAANKRFDRVRPKGHIRSEVLTNTSAIITSAVSASPLVLDTFNITVPQNKTWRGIVEFSAESVCFNASGYCVVNVLVDGSSAGTAPNVGSDFAFDSTENDTATSSRWKSLSTRRLISELPAGPHTIEVVAFVTNASVNFRLDDWVTTLDLYNA